MGRLLHLRGDPHEETQALLPWYATGQAEPADRFLIESHMAICAECREDLAHERRLSTAIRELPLAAGGPWEQLASRLTDRQAEPVKLRPWWRQPVRIDWFVAAQAAMVVLCVALFVASERPAATPSPAYRALSDAPATRTGNVLVMFAPTTSEQLVRAAIQAANARLVDGPTDAGAYLLAVPPAERSTALAALRARREVTLAQPMDASPR